MGEMYLASLLPQITKDKPRVAFYEFSALVISLMFSYSDRSVWFIMSNKVRNFNKNTSNILSSNNSQHDRHGGRDLRKGQKKYWNSKFKFKIQGWALIV